MKNLIYQILTFVLSVAISAVCAYFSFNPVTGLESLKLIVIIPLVLIFYVILLSTLTPCVITGFKATFSDNLGIKITSIILLTLTALLVLFDVYTGLNMFGIKIF